jgi:D-amino peptidase
MMKIYMSVDLEGITGVVGSYQCLIKTGALPEVRKLVTGDVNAAIKGAVEAGAKTIWVNENHSGRDLLSEELDPIANVLFGKPKPLMTLEGLDSSFDAVFLIGLHAAAGTMNAVMDHTWKAKCIQNLRVNGVTIGEIGLNALLAGHYGVPVSLVTGDQATAHEAKELLGDVECAIVKTAVGRYSALCPHPSEARRIIQEAASRAISNGKRFIPFNLDYPIRMEIDYENAAYASCACWIPTAERVSSRTVAFNVPDFLSGMKTFMAAAALPKTVEDPIY